MIGVGQGVSRHKVGDRVVGAIHGGKYDNIGSAAEYCVAADDLVFKVPESMSSEDAATFGVGFLTAAAVSFTAWLTSLISVCHIDEPRFCIILKACLDLPPKSQMLPG